MPKKEPLTLYNQDAFCVEEDCRVSSFEYEDWESPAKISSLLWENSAFIGAFEFSEELKADLNRSAKQSFRKLLSSDKAYLSLMEEQILTLEAIVLTQEMDRDQNRDERRLWEYLFLSLGYDSENEKQTSYQLLYKRCREILEETIRKHNRIFADFGEGQRYYNTLNIHALTPASSIEHLYNILYSFYSKNLECQYEANDPTFHLLVQNIAKRWDVDKKDEMVMKLRLDVLSSGFKMLFLHRPNFMAAICDALTERIDFILKNGVEQLNCDNRWNLILKQWFCKKTAYEQKKMQERQKQASKGHVITRKEEIHPKYVLYSEEVSLSIPKLRLPEITERPVIILLQNDRIISQANMSVFGDDLCLTTRDKDFSISHNELIDWNAPLNIQVKILCGDREVYNSGTSLFRKYLMFSAQGQEIRMLRHRYPVIYLLCNHRANVEIVDENEDYLQLDAEGQLLRIGMSTLKTLQVDREDILAQSQKTGHASYYLSKIAEDQAYLQSGQEKYEIYREAPDITIELPQGDSSKNYFIFIDSVKHGLYEYEKNNSGIQLTLPNMHHYFHRVELRRFSDNQTIFQVAYVVIPEFTSEFERSVYPNKSFDSYVKVRCLGNTKTIPFRLSENQTEIVFALRDDADCHVKIPKLNAVLSGKNAFNLPKICWHEYFELSDFLRLEAPNRYKASLMLGVHPVSAQGQHYELGNYLHQKTDWKEDQLALGILVRNGKEIVCQELLTTIAFSETFTEAPIIVHQQDDEDVARIIDWEPENKFIGPSNSEFWVELDNDQNSSWRYTAELKKQNLERRFPCIEDTYHYRIWLKGTKKLFTKKADKVIYEGSIQIGDPAASRFHGKEIRLRKVCFWSCVSKKQEMAFIRDGDAILSDLGYMGCSVPEGEDICYPEYEADFVFQLPNGKYQELCSNEFSREREWINPVTVWIKDDRTVFIRARNGNLLLVNTKRFYSGRTVRVVDMYQDMSKEEQYRYINDADYFEYEVVPKK